MKGVSAPAYNDAAAEKWLGEHPPPRWHTGMLGSEALESLTDFELFCDRYFGERLFSYQREWLRLMLEESHAQILAPPRHGKTEVFSVMLPCWLLAGGGLEAAVYEGPEVALRDAQVMLVSASADQARKNFLAIEARLTANRKLLEDFGRFREPDLPWRQSDGVLIVAGRQRDVLSGDYSLCCMGAKSEVLGRGAHTILLDDIASLKNCRTPQQAEEHLTWLQTEILSRLEPEGRIFSMGAHLPVPQDAYTLIENLPLYDDTELTDDSEPDVVGHVEENAKLFRTVRYPAVLDFEERELLSPRPDGRYTWGQMMRIRAGAGQHVWESTYMQRPQAAGVALCSPEWIYGTDGYPGCLDSERGLGDTRSFEYGQVELPMVRILSCDPSPTRYAGNVLEDIPIFPVRDQVYAPVIVDLERGILPLGRLVDLWIDWWHEYHFQALVLERNAAHTLMQSDEYARFRQMTRVRVIEHNTTGLSKSHDDYGKHTLAKDVEYGYVSIPYGDPPARWKAKSLIDELCETVPTDDLVMALWFPKYHLNEIRKLVQRSAYIPSFTHPDCVGDKPAALEAVG